MFLMRKLLWVDCIAAFIGGMMTLLLHGVLSQMYGLPREMLLLIGVVNLMYSGYSFLLAIRARRPMGWIYLLVIANLCWAVVCWSWAFEFSQVISIYGMCHLVGEGLFVGGLGCLEWRWRQLLYTS